MKETDPLSETLYSGKLKMLDKFRNDSHISGLQSRSFAFPEKLFIVYQPLYWYLSAIVISTQKSEEEIIFLPAAKVLKFPKSYLQ
jgi:hypothetical protein